MQCLILAVFFLVRVMVFTVFVATSFGDGFRAFHHKGAAFRAYVAGRAGFYDKFAVGVV